MDATAAHLFALIDAYAEASAARHAALDSAPWAFVAAHERMTSARARIADALAFTPPPLTDETTRCAHEAAESEAAWRRRVDALVTGAEVTP